MGVLTTQTNQSSRVYLRLHAGNIRPLTMRPQRAEHYSHGGWERKKVDRGDGASLIRAFHGLLLVSRTTQSASERTIYPLHVPRTVSNNRDGTVYLQRQCWRLAG